jgi:hypothetical protein
MKNVTEFCHRCGRYGNMLVLLAVTISPWVFILGFPPTHFGHWYQSQPCLVGIHAFCALISLGFLLLLSANDQTARESLVHPLVLVPAGLGLLSLAMSPWALDVSTSFLGLPQTGMGAVWFFDMAAFIAGGILASRAGFLRLLGLSAAAATSVMVIAASGLVASPDYSPLPLPEYAAFAVLGVVPAVLLAFPGRTGARALAAVLAALLLALVKTKSALYAFVPISLVIGAVHRFRPQLLRNGFLCGGAALAMPVLASCSLELGVGQGWISVGYGSLYSRMEMHRLTQASFSDAWWRLATGFGWGSFPDVLIAHAKAVSGPLSGLVEYDRTVWEGLREPFFHSFNFLLESLLALGIWGAIGALAWFFLAGYCCPSRLRPIVLPYMLTLFVLWTMWFEFPSTLPMIGLVFVCCAGDTALLRPRKSFWIAVLVCCALASQLLAVLAESNDISAVEKEERLIRLSTPQAVAALRLPWTEFADRGGYTLAVLLERSSAAVKDDPRYALAFLSRMYRARQRIERGGASLRLLESYVRAEGRLAHSLTDPSWDIPRQAFLGAYGQSVALLLDKIPSRNDLSIAYLEWAMAFDPKGRDAVVGRLLGRDPDDPVGNFFLARALAAQPDPKKKKEALERFHAVKAHGIDRFLDEKAAGPPDDSP